MPETNPSTWRVVLVDAVGCVVDPAAHDGREVHVSVRRATALPVDGRLPAICWAEDVAAVNGGPSTDVARRLASAQEMADRLNAEAVNVGD